MKVMLWIVVVLFVTGCERPEPTEAQHPGQFSCTDEEWDKVESQTKWCNENTSYFSTACLMQALRRNCKDTISGSHPGTQ